MSIVRKAVRAERAIALDSNSTPARLGLAYTLLRSGMLDKAAQAFTVLHDADPTSPQGQLGLASVDAARRGVNLVNAEDTIRQVLARNPKRARAHYILGLILQEQGKTEPAATSYKTAARLLLNSADPDQWIEDQQGGAPHNDTSSIMDEVSLLSGFCLT